jgi:hypothetical protein
MVSHGVRHATTPTAFSASSLENAVFLEKTAILAQTHRRAVLGSKVEVYF